MKSEVRKTHRDAITYVYAAVFVPLGPSTACILLKLAGRLEPTREQKRKREKEKEEAEGRGRERERDMKDDGVEQKDVIMHVCVYHDHLRPSRDNSSDILLGRQLNGGEKMKKWCVRKRGL